jgi:sulfur carrier protein
MIITVNGHRREYHNAPSITQLLADENLAGKRVAVEVDRAVIPRSLHADTQLQDGAVVEIIHAIGGG